MAAVDCVDVIITMSFFFFKQKTAYEMRISDWSSDVCSSDLLDSIRSAASSMGSSLEELLAKTGLFMHGSTVVDNTILTREGAKTGQIGRASCRARVCQYV